MTREAAINLQAAARIQHAAGAMDDYALARILAQTRAVLRAEANADVARGRSK